MRTAAQQPAAPPVILAPQQLRPWAVRPLPAHHPCHHQVGLLHQQRRREEEERHCAHHLQRCVCGRCRAGVGIATRAARRDLPTAGVATLPQNSRAYM